MDSREGKRQRPLRALAIGAVALAAVAWDLFHPDFRVDPHQVGAAVRAELGKTGFRATQGIRATRFARHEAQAEVSLDTVNEQHIEAIDEVLTEKRSKAHREESDLAVLEETSGLYAGPITVLYYWREKPPLIGDLLPYQFWNSSRLSEFIVESNRDFPYAVGGKLVARFAYEQRFSDGAAAPGTRGRLECEVAQLEDANLLDKRLSGQAARIECREAFEPRGGARYAHWYVLERGWSIPIDGEWPVSFAGAEETRYWRMKLTSFEEAPAN
jgi:hypothetical protein